MIAGLLRLPIIVKKAQIYLEINDTFDRINESNQEKDLFVRKDLLNCEM